MTTSQAFHPSGVFRRLKFTGTLSPVDFFTSVRTVAVVSLAQAVRSAAIVAPRTRLLLEVAARAAQRTARRREAQRRGLRRQLIRRSAAVGFVLGAATAGAVRAGGSSPGMRR